MAKISKLIPAHKKMAMGGKPYKKGGLVHEKAESAAYERKEEKTTKGMKKGGFVKKGCK